LSGEVLPDSVLLDTCAVIWLANAEHLTPLVVETIRNFA
jgi:hypothetical protein